jgi:hypothetical protein
MSSSPEPLWEDVSDGSESGSQAIDKPSQHNSSAPSQHHTSQPTSLSRLSDALTSLRQHSSAPLPSASKEHQTRSLISSLIGSTPGIRKTSAPISAAQRKRRTASPGPSGSSLMSMARDETVSGLRRPIIISDSTQGRQKGSKGKQRAKEIGKYVRNSALEHPN